MVWATDDMRVRVQGAVNLLDAWRSFDLPELTVEQRASVRDAWKKARKEIDAELATFVEQY